MVPHGCEMRRPVEGRRRSGRLRWLFARPAGVWRVAELAITLTPRAGPIEASNRSPVGSAHLRPILASALVAVAIGMVVLDVPALDWRYSSTPKCSIPRLCSPVRRLIMHFTSGHTQPGRPTRQVESYAHTPVASHFWFSFLKPSTVPDFGHLVFPAQNSSHCFSLVQVVQSQLAAPSTH